MDVVNGGLFVRSQIATLYKNNREPILKSQIEAYTSSKNYRGYLITIACISS